MPNEDLELGASKTCFVISPIGSRLAPVGTEARTSYEDSIQMWEFVFQPAAEAFGMTPIRADRIAQPGEIPEQIFTLLRDADVVLADLSGANPNVMYELGLRHTQDLLTIQLGEYGRLPFDVNVIRTVQFRRTEAGLIDARNSLIEALRAGLGGDRSLLTATRVWVSTTPNSAIVSGAIASADGSDDPIDGSPVPGFIDVLAAGEDAISRLGGTLARAGEAMNQMASATQAAQAAVHASDARGRGFAGRLRVATETAEALAEPAESIEQASSEYAELLEITDGAIQYVIGSVRSGNESLSDAEEFFRGLLELADTSSSVGTSLNEFREEARGLGRIAGALQPVSRKIDRSAIRLIGGIDLITGWGRQVRELLDGDDGSAALATT